MGIFYATREQVKRAASIQGTSEDDALDRLLNGQTDAIRLWLCRHFYPLLKTYTYKDSKYLLFNGRQLWPCEDLLSISEITFDDVSISAASLGPANAPLPFSYVDLGASYYPTTTQTLEMTAVVGYCNDEAAAGTLVGALDIDDLTFAVSDSGAVGIGDLIHLDDERMIVTDKTLLDTSESLSDDVDALDSTTLIPVSDGTSFSQGETITIGSERMFIESIAANNLIVKRAYDGTTLATHANNDSIYAPRTVTVERAAAGTETETHADTTVIYRNVPPGLITELVIAEVIAAREQEKSGYARNIGQGDGVMELRGLGLGDLRKRVEENYLRCEVTL